MNDELDQFFSNNERRAYRMAQLATNNSDDAIDIVQEAMISLVKNYRNRPQHEWPALFHRILQRHITNWYRRQKIHKTFFHWFNSHYNEEESDVIGHYADPVNRSPDHIVSTNQSLEQLQLILFDLPMRQRQVFLLRCLEGLDTKQTAKAMACSEGIVKTHYHRSLQFIRSKMEDQE